LVLLLLLLLLEIHTKYSSHPRLIQKVKKRKKKKTEILHEHIRAYSKYSSVYYIYFVSVFISKTGISAGIEQFTCSWLCWIQRIQIKTMR